MFEQYLADLTHTDPTVRYEAAQKLGASNDPRAIQPLIAALPDENSKVQYAAFSGLIKLNAYEAAAPILDMLLSDLDSRVWQLLKLNIGLRLRTGLLDMMPHGDAEMTEQIVRSLDTPRPGRAPARAVPAPARSRRHRRLRRDADRHSDQRLAHASGRGGGGARLHRRCARRLAAAAVPRRQPQRTARDRRRSAGSHRSRQRRRPAARHARRRERVGAPRRRRRAGRSGDRRAIEPLSAALQDENTLVQDAAFEALKKLSYGSYDVTL